MSNRLNNSNYDKEIISPLGEAMEEVLPELMIRNTKLGNRLKTKLKVCSLLNNIELRNQHYLKEFVSSSEKTLQDLKSGLCLSKAMSISANKLSQLNSRILNDCFMKKNDLIYKTNRSLIKRNKEQESNMIIKQSISSLRECINPTFKIAETPKIVENTKKFLSESELSDVKKIINNKISADEKIIKQKIKNYLDKVKMINFATSRNADLIDNNSQRINKDSIIDFRIFAKYFSFKNDLGMIHYQKVRPAPLRDKSCPSIENIRENLFPEIKEGKIGNNYVNINNSNSVKIISGMKMYRKIGKRNKAYIDDEKENNSNDISDIIVNDKKDSFNTLKKIIIRNKSLVNRTTNRYNKISSLMDINLPKISEYETLVINKTKKNKEIKRKKNNSNKKGKNKIDIYHFLNSDLIKEFRELRDEIKNLKSKKIDIEGNYIKHHENSSNILYNYNDFINKRNINNNEHNNISSCDQKLFTPNHILRMPSSHSMSIIKRKVNIVNNKDNNNRTNRKNRNCSNYTRDRTSASTIKNSVSSIFTPNKNEKKYNEIFNYINKKNILTNNSSDIHSLISPKQRSNIQLKKSLQTNNATNNSEC